MLTKRGGFTLFEVMLMVLIIGVGTISIVVALANGVTFMQKTREKTIAINLAREGIEAVYQIRDTNWKKRGGKKESCWLKTDPSLLSTDCKLDAWMGTGYYVLKTYMSGGQQYFALSGYQTGLDLSNSVVDTNDQNFALCQNTGDNSRYPCTSQYSREGQSFRQIRGIGLFDKDPNTLGGKALNCTNGNTPAVCNSNSAKEYRFCSEVHYIGRGQSKVELCGVMTNFSK